MKLRSVLVLLLMVAAGCKSKAGAASVRLLKPSGVALFYGYSLRSPTVVHPYIAVAASRGDELRLIDAIDDQVVLSPTVVTPLAVPVDPRPSLLAAGSLGDPDPTTTPQDRPWLLASASTGMVARPDALPGEPAVSSQIQVVATWKAATVVERSMTIDLATISGVADAVILSMVVVPKPVGDGAGGWVAKPGEARLLVGLSGGRLMVVEVSRAADGQAITLGTADLPAPVIQTLGFEPVSMAGSPDLEHLYVATPDPIGAVEGVAELDTVLPPGGWPVRGLDARGPTTHVVAGLVGEFKAFRTDGLPGHVFQPWEASPVESDLFSEPALRVYASLDPGKCGRSWRIACGIAVIDPVAGGLLPDPATPPTAVSITPSQRYFAPIQVPDTVLDMVLVTPPVVPPKDVTDNILANPPQPPMMVVAPGSGRRLTSALLAVAASDGRTYVIDVGHWAAPSDVSVINTYSEKSTTTRTRVLTAVNALPFAGTNATTGAGIPQPAGTPYVSLWSDSDLPTSYTNLPTEKPVGFGLKPDFLYDTTGMVLHPHVTPGYSETETWTITFQGTLPGLQLRGAQVSLTTSGTNQTTGWAAIQEPTGFATGDQFRSVARLYDPSLAVHLGDVVQILPIEPDQAHPICPAGSFELEVTDLLFPSADYPGGAVQLGNRVCRDGLGTVVDCPGDPTCLSGRGPSEVLLSFRAGSMLLTGTGTGYAGRPPIVSDPTVSPLFRFEYEDEDALSCPMLEPGAPWPPAAACDAACRSECERLVLARKARRYYYVTSSLVCDGWTDPYKQMCTDVWRNLAWPITTGPVLAFRVGLNDRSRGIDGAYDNNPAFNVFTARGAFLQISVVSGVAPMYRVPRASTVPSGAVLPTGLTTFDRSASTGLVDDGVRVYSSYPQNEVLDFNPAGALNDVTTIR